MCIKKFYKKWKTLLKSLIFLTIEIEEILPSLIQV